MAIFCSERRDSGTKITMKKTSSRATREARITTASSLPGEKKVKYAVFFYIDPLFPIRPDRVTPNPVANVF